MYRARLRPKYTDEQLAEVYDRPHNAAAWRDHIQRIEATVSAAHWVIGPEPIYEPYHIADLSTGNAAIPSWIARRYLDNPVLHLGDFAPGYDYTGPVEKTIDEIPYVDMFILSETIEHLDDPDAVLRQIRAKSRTLVLSTPDGEDNDLNPEHYWGWDAEAMRYMLLNAGWNPQTFTSLNFDAPEFIYSYQIWVCT